MNRERSSLRGVSTSVLVALRDAIASGALATPVDRAALVGFGLRHGLDAIAGALAGHRTAACVAILDVCLAERDERRPAPDLVWSGPEAPLGAARDTAVVLRELFEGARESVILAGYRFDHAHDVLAPLARVMKERGVVAWFFVDVEQPERAADAEGHLERALGRFMAENWPFGEPRPRLFHDRRAAAPGPPWSSLHAKCVVVDGLRAFVSSANFTERGQERNIEVGVSIDDARFAGALAAQWLRLLDAKLVTEVTLP